MSGTKLGLRRLQVRVESFVTVGASSGPQQLGRLSVIVQFAGPARYDTSISE